MTENRLQRKLGELGQRLPTLQRFSSEDLLGAPLKNRKPTDTRPWRHECPSTLIDNPRMLRPSLRTPLASSVTDIQFVGDSSDWQKASISCEPRSPI